MNDMKLIRKEGVQAQLVGDEFILLDNASGQVHQLNVTASFIWEKCNGDNSIEDIASALTEAFELTQQQAVQDVRTVLEDFQSKSLVLVKL